MNVRFFKRAISFFTTAALMASMVCSGTTANAESGTFIDYTFTGANASDAGYAEGIILVTADVSGTYDLYWADDEKALDGYYPIASIEVKAGKHQIVQMGDHTAIPANATKIIATKGSKNVSSAKAVYSVPLSKQLSSASGDLLYTFNSYSDVHIDKKGYYKKAEEHLAEAFEFGVLKNTDFIVSSGDMVTNKSGPDDEWTTYEKILSKSNYVNPVWECTGNHDTRCGVESGLKSFVRATGTDSTKANIDKNKPYYYMIEQNTGDLFIFMALENKSNPSKYDEFSDEQLAWVTNLLETYYNSGVNVFLVEHSPISGFGAGDRMSDPYYKAMLSEKFSSTVKFKNILKKYKNMIFMSGHTHEDFEMGYNYSNENNNACHMIHNPAVAGSTKEKDDSSLDYNKGYGFNSQGYYVETYQNRIIFYGANLTDKLIYPQYSYIMEGSRNTPAVSSGTDDITLSGETVPAEDKLSEVSSVLSSYYKYASYDQYQALKKLYFQYRDDSTSDKNVIAKFDEKIAELKAIAGKSDTTVTYSIGNKYYFENTKSWSKVYAYAWDDSAKNAEWPGVMLKPIGTSNGKHLYCIEFERNGQYKNIIFTDGDHQTVDIALGQYSDNAFRINGKDSKGKYTVENFKYDNGTSTGSDSDTGSDTDTETVTVSEEYALLYYIEGEHDWSTMDAWFIPKSDGTYRYAYTATDDCKISFSVYDKTKKVYLSLPESLKVNYEEGKTFESDLKSQSSRGRSLTIRELTKDNTVSIIFDPKSQKIIASCNADEADTGTITWKNYDGTILRTDENIPYGTIPAYNGDTPTREGDAQYTYTFSEWSPEVSEVNGDVEYTAVFIQILKAYTVTWVNEDGSILEKDENVPYGTTPTYDGETPTKQADAQFSYTFDHWDKKLVPVTEDTVYTAVYTETNNKFTVTFETDGGSTVKTQSVENNKCALKPENPTKDGYTFIDWFNGNEKYDFNTPVTANITLTAKWEKETVSDTEPETDSETNTEQTDTSSDNTDTNFDNTDTVTDSTDTNTDQTDTSSDNTDTSFDQTDTTSDNTDTNTEQTDTASDNTDTNTEQTDTASDNTDTNTDQTDTASDNTDTNTDQTDTASDNTDTSSDQTDTVSDNTDTNTDQTDTASDNTDTSSDSTDTNSEKGDTDTPDKPDKGIFGDVDGDGKVSAKDSMLIQRYTINLKKLTENQLLAADVNFDGKVTSKDALEILRYTINLSKNDKIGNKIA